VWVHAAGFFGSGFFLVFFGAAFFGAALWVFAEVPFVAVVRVPLEAGAAADAFGFTTLRGSAPSSPYRRR